MATRRPPLRVRQVVVLSVLVAGAIALFSVLVPLQATFYGTPLAMSFVLAAAVCGAPLLAIRNPRTASVIACAATFALPLLVTAHGGAAGPWPWSVPAMLSFLLLVAVVSFRHGARLGLLPLVTGLLVALAAPVLRPDVQAGGAATANLIVTASLGVGVYLIAVLVAGRMRVAEELTREREHSALEESRRVLVEERTRIARELHDVIAHSMSVIQVQASTAKYRISDLDERASVEFDDIAATARTSLTEMRRMLGVLRTEDQSAELAPQQGLADIPSLVDSVRRAGAAVELTGDTGDAVVTAPATVQIAAFRIVQEALSNAVRHAPGATVRVRVDTDRSAIRIRVDNDPSATTSASPGAGYGLRGMRERAELLGGSARSGRMEDGGWRVDASLPFQNESGGAGAVPRDGRETS
ncbi:sensor histidine kinase [Microbacterium sp. XT11]|uniref:sensor histidine kinase n=1 Tax=Microbacterium sp. XT11 TaxID=367477 RepID=UPI000742D393|nr:sensor histidine kinase [Microbacterium sp. XT11]ALX67061.1 hypothetical protein AB663_002704 [Microbacterium sp. XT11]